MNLENLNDETLLEQTLKLAQNEREITLKVLHHLKEVERRRLFSAKGFPSLFAYCTERLGYSEGSAQRRIQAMRALKDLPQIAAKIESGALTLSNLAQAQTLFSQQRKAGNAYSVDDKIWFLAKLENKSTRDAERAIAREFPAMARADRIRPMNDHQNELNTIVDNEFIGLLSQLKGRLAHKYPTSTTGEILKLAVQMALQQMDISATKDIGGSTVSESEISIDPTISADSTASTTTSDSLPPAPAVNSSQTRKKRNLMALRPTVRAPQSSRRSKSIPASTRREIWRNAKGKCENCGSMHALEIDHRKPRALGGDDSFANLQLLCRSCNQRAAIEKFGVKKMDRYLNATAD